MAGTYGRTPGGNLGLLHLPRWSSGTGLRAIMCAHGRTGDRVQFAQGNVFGVIPPRLADRGYAVAAADMGGTSFGNAAAQAVLDAQYTDLVSLGSYGTKVGLLIYSMGGFAGSLWAMDNPNKVAAILAVNPALDGRWLYALAGYAPSYATGGLTPNPAWRTDMDASYGGNWAAASNPGRDPYQQFAAFRNRAYPWKIAAATDDAAIPPAAAGAFIAAVNDPKVTAWPTAIVGGHVGAPSTLDPVAVADFFDGGAW